MTTLTWQQQYPYTGTYYAQDANKEHTLVVYRVKAVGAWYWEVNKSDEEQNDTLVSADDNYDYAASGEEAKEKAEQALHNLKQVA